jgi:hypothetical protein
MAGKFQPDDGGIGCLSCDNLGDYFQERDSATACEQCPLNTRRYPTGAIKEGAIFATGANKTSCACKEGALRAACHASCGEP